MGRLSQPTPPWPVPTNGNWAPATTYTNHHPPSTTTITPTCLPRQPLHTLRPQRGGNGKALSTGQSSTVASRPRRSLSLTTLPSPTVRLCRSSRYHRLLARPAQSTATQKAQVVVAAASMQAPRPLDTLPRSASSTMTSPPLSALDMILSTTAG